MNKCALGFYPVFGTRFRTRLVFGRAVARLLSETHKPHFERFPRWYGFIEVGDDVSLVAL